MVVSPKATGLKKSQKGVNPQPGIETVKYRESLDDCDRQSERGESSAGD